MIGRRRQPIADLGVVLALLTGLGAASADARGAEADAEPTLLRDVELYDGSGEPPRRTSVRLRDGRVAEIGELRPAPEERVVEGRELALAPGFVDSHSHADDGLEQEPTALALVSQGITTAVVGLDGGSLYPLADFFDRLEASPPSVNVASYSGHNTLRARVLAPDSSRAATEREIAAMAALLRADLAAGALGLSTGLEYEPGVWSTTDELVALARVAADAGGRYASHIRSEDRELWSAIEELLEVARRTEIPVHLSHAKLAMTSLHGEAPRLVARLESARRQGIEVSADLYPYLYWLSSLEVFFPDREFEDLETARFALTEVAPPERIYLTRYRPEPDYAGRSVAGIARLRGEAPERTLSWLAGRAQRFAVENGAAAGRVESVLAFSMSEDDVETLLRWPHTNLATDGGLRGAHPRGFGAFPRFLGVYSRDRGVLSLTETIRRATSLAAANVGLEERGRVRAGGPADLVLFDPRRIGAGSTLDAPHQTAEGIERVWVNGVVVYESGEATGARPGRVLRRSPRAR